jgi:hypothetical protein
VCGLTGEDFVEDETERVDVRPRRGAATSELLGRHVRGRPGEQMRIATFVGERRKAEVGDAHTAVTIEQGIRRFQIAMQDAAIVRRRESRAQLSGDLERLVRRQTPDSPKQRGEILAVDVFHREEVKAGRVDVDFTDVVDATDVRMRDLPGQSHFLMEPRQPLRVLSEVLWQELERDRLTELEIVGAIDLTHPAATEHRNDAIAAGEDGTGNEPGVVDRIGRRRTWRGRRPAHTR